MSKKSAKQPEPKKSAPKKNFKLDNAPWYLKNSGAFFLIALVSFLLYFNTLSFEYAQDDSIVINDNMFTQQGAKGIKDILTHDTFLGFFKVEKNLVAGGRYRPLSLVTFALEKEYFGDSPHTSHFINVLLYALCGIFIYLMLKQLLLHSERYGRFKLLPLLTTLLFIAHPMHTEAIANIKGRDEIMSMLFCSMGTYLLLQYMDGARSMAKMILSFVCFFLGMLSKENAITFFLVVPLAWMLFRKSERNQFISLMLPLAVATVLFLILRQSFTNTSLGKEVTELMNNPFTGMTAAEKFATIIFTFGKYLLLLVFPLKLTSDYYPFAITAQTFSSPAVLLTLAVIAFAAFCAFRFWKREPLIAFSILFFSLTFSVVSNLVFPVGTFMSERFVFMPSLGFCLLLAFGIHRLSDYLTARETSFSNLQISKSPNQFARFAVSVFSIIMLLYSVRTIARNPAWENNFSLFTTDVLNSPNSAKANNAAGGVLLDYADKEKNPQEKKKMTDLAKTYLKKALQLYPKYSNAYLLLGNAYFKGDTDYATSFHYYKEALVMYPNYTDAYKNLKTLLVNWKDYQAQEDSVHNFIYKSPGMPVPYYVTGLVYENMKKPDSALLNYQIALKILPEFPDALFKIGVCYGMYFNKLDSAIYFLEKAKKVDPLNAEIYENLGTAYGMSRNVDAAISVLNQGIQMFPNNSRLYFNLSVAYRSAGNNSMADDCLAKSKSLEQKLDVAQ